LKAVITHKLITLITFLAWLLTAYLFVIVPKGFMPLEDQGQIMASRGLANDFICSHGGASKGSGAHYL